MRSLRLLVVLLVLCSCPALSKARENANHGAKQCNEITRTVVDSVIRADMKYHSQNDNQPHSDCPFGRFLSHLQKCDGRRGPQQFARFIRFLDGEYPEMVLPLLVESLLRATKEKETIVWDDDLCWALEGIYDLQAEELIQPLAEAGFTYDVVSKRCLFDTQ